MIVKEITDKKIWEAYITQYSPNSLFQSWNWGEVAKKLDDRTNNTKLWRLGFYLNNKLFGIAQVVKVKAKRGIYIQVRHGPILSEWSKKNILMVTDYLKKIGCKENAYFIRMNPLISSSEDNKQIFKEIGFIDAPIHAMDGELVWVLDLNKKKEEIFSGMRKTTRYLIRKGEKLGVKIFKSQNKEDIDNFLILYKKTATRHHFIPHKGIKEEFVTFLKDKQIILFRGYYNNRLLSAALILFYNKQAIYHHSASIEQKVPVSYVLQWEVIKEVMNRGISIYNFWGIAPEDNLHHPWVGLSMFKKGFGGRKVEYLHTKDFILSPKYYFTYLFEYGRKIIKRY
ncbi:hypothetical protein COV53_04605 [Candidatus Gottesmanbacteria bacterium CG11_big_fil_rev_8_21_14_0_20_37_11]|uniref:BioF2-like acetyltransferase domain-containing protein n=2 Tax=Candidatus Gottesmaniibacteriota TaxID=1752720 RepID=A0A2M7RS75_9BACT|nr:MAG: hypothetical protein COX23_04295 [Candidatus Gottesmanbacteria bacterium CG23_combo_of_CG06-09_8_20_14_all_37_19]PIR08137.1 MAG: hypothetical protein COV53_04605 [Candidatus Gottesmanbacteria bacterium CG11_big_fil_rev_8_21_14_0_20_37_11]PIZ02915.1 MAG: hypothetical protein COY59_02200 [Candidatus Gottesmanbacteria bacterium CG_4_10_14_0_8_um_filter_37_24]